MGKNKQDNARGLYISKDARILTSLLEHLYQKRYMPKPLLKALLTQIGHKGINQDKVDQLTEYLSDSELPVAMDKNSVVWEGLYAKGLAGRRNFQYATSKVDLAKCVADLLEKQQPRSILLCAGTTVLAVVREIINRIQRNELTLLQEFYTNNLIALSELVLYSGEINIHVPEGRIDLRDGAITGKWGLKSYSEIPFDAIVTSFFGFGPDIGFHSDHDGDAAEKLMNLRHNKCSKIYIVLSWRKMGTRQEPVATLEKGIDPQKEYYFITDPPKKWLANKTDKDERTVWADMLDMKNINIVYANDPAR